MIAQKNEAAPNVGAAHIKNHSTTLYPTIATECSQVLDACDRIPVPTFVPRTLKPNYIRRRRLLAVLGPIATLTMAAAAAGAIINWGVTGSVLGILLIVVASVLAVVIALYVEGEF